MIGSVQQTNRAYATSGTVATAPDSTRVQPQSAPPAFGGGDTVKSTFVKPSGHVPTAAELTTIKAVVVDILPDRHNARSGLDHQVLMVKVIKVTGGLPAAQSAGPTATSVRGKILEVDNDISPTIGTKATVVKGQTISLRGELYHNAARGDKPESDGIHWTHHADTNGDCGYIKVSVHGKVKTFE